MTRGTSDLLPSSSFPLSLSLTLAPLRKVACQMHCKMKRRLPFVLPERKRKKSREQEATEAA